MTDGADEVRRAIAGAESFLPPAAVIRLVPGKLAEQIDQAEAALMRAGVSVYSRGDSLVRPVIDEVPAANGGRTRCAQLVVANPLFLRELLARAVDFERYDARRKQFVAADPPRVLAEHLAARHGAWAFPKVRGVLAAPTLRPDGSVLDREGYDETTGLILAASPSMPRLPAAPDRAVAFAALAVIEALLAEFPFDDDASKSVALSAFLTAAARGAFQVAPLHAARAPQAGTGKSFLWDCASAMATGQACPAITPGRTEEELEKRLGAVLLAGLPIINLDNCSAPLAGDALCQAVERPVVQIRPLGHSQVVRIEAGSTMFVATGNSLIVGGDMTRRTLVASLDAKLERPEHRRFKRNPMAVILADRGRVLAAALTVVRAYIAAGRPNPAPPLGSFEEWSNTVRSALIWLGCADPVATMERTRDEDPELVARRIMLAAWIETFGEEAGPEHSYTVAQLIEMAQQQTTPVAGEPATWRYSALRAAIQHVASVRGRLDSRVLGWWFRKNRGAVCFGRRFAGAGDACGHPTNWFLETVPPRW